MVANTTLAADIFKSSEFLKWKPDSRSYYIRTSIGMASFIAIQNDKKHSKCIDDWYTKNSKLADKAIEDVMRKFPSYHPRGIILAMLEKKCGTFTYSKR